MNVQRLTTAWNNGREFRFGVARLAEDGSYVTSGTYKLAVGGRDSVYFMSRQAKHHMKISLHATDHWQLTYDGRQGGPALQSQRVFGPGRPDREEKIRAVRLFVCEDALTRRVDERDSQIGWVSPQIGTEAVEFQIWLVPVQNPENVVGVDNDGRVVSLLPLPSGTRSVAVVAFPAELPPWEDVVFKSLADTPGNRLRDRMGPDVASTMFWSIARNDEVRIIEAGERLSSRIA